MSWQVLALGALSVAAGDEAHGVPALIRHLTGEITLEESALIGPPHQALRKSAFTWFRPPAPEFALVNPEAAKGCLRPSFRGARSANPNDGLRSAGLQQ